MLILSGIALIQAALAGDVCPDLRVQAAASSTARSSAAASQVCQVLGEGLALCFACGDKPLTAAELAASGVTREALLDRAKAAGAAALERTPPSRVQIPDMTGAYWVRAAGDGYDAAGLLHPQTLQALAGTVPVVAVPADGVLLFWAPGDAETDKVIAVGVRRMFEQAAAPVSDKVYRYKDGAWVVWAELQGGQPAAP